MGNTKDMLREIALPPVSLICSGQLFFERARPQEDCMVFEKVNAALMVVTGIQNAKVPAGWSVTLGRGP